MAVRANGLLLGHSGVRPLVVQRLVALLNAGYVPACRSTGSLGASGDLGAVGARVSAAARRGPAFGTAPAPS